MSEVADIAGREFDWFAEDDAGHFAVFATAGSGPVPSRAQRAIQAHNNISDSIVVSGWGTPLVWESYSRAGLFAYDWHDSNGCYMRVAIPQESLPAELARKIRAMSEIVRVPVMFSATPKLESAQVMTPNTSFERTREG